MTHPLAGLRALLPRHMRLAPIVGPVTAPHIPPRVWAGGVEVRSSRALAKARVRVWRRLGDGVLGGIAAVVLMIGFVMLRSGVI